MTKVAVWCRHAGDNIIGIGPDIPWNVPSDVRKFNRIVSGKNIVAGRVTYETLPPSFDSETIYVLTTLKEFALKNPARHHLINDIRFFKDFEEDLYICGGAKVYEAFLTQSPKLMPDIVVDCVYHGELYSKAGEAVNITPCIEVLNKKYFKITPDYEQDKVTTTVYVKRGDFVEQSVLKSILAIIEKDN